MVNPSASPNLQRCPQGDIFRELLGWNFIPSPSVVFRRSCLTRVGLLDKDARGLEEWGLWVRVAELYAVLAVEEPVAVWRRPAPQSGQFTSRPERLHRLARRLLGEKWLRLPRVAAAGSGRHEIAAAFRERAAEKLFWTLAERVKARRLADSARVAAALFGMYPVTGSRKILTETARRLTKTARHES